MNGTAETALRHRVLLVDARQPSLLLAALALRERGFDVVEASDGERALEIVAASTPDIVVIDGGLPGRGSYGVCDALRQLPGCASLPVLMLVAHDDEESVCKAYRAGATDFFVRSQQWGLLAGRLHYMLRAARTRHELERSKAKLARAQELARMGSFDCRRGGRLVLSDEALHVLGLPSGTVAGWRKLLRSMSAAQRAALLRDARLALEHASVLASDVVVTLDDGRRCVLRIEAEPEFDDRGRLLGYAGILQDVSDRRSADEQIRHLANYDALTGLPNRRQLFARIEQALEAARRLEHSAAVLLIDLDRFKGINETLGHDAGDELLIEVARRLCACLRHAGTDDAADPQDQLAHRRLECVGRFGADEFVALLPEVVNERDAQRVARRVLEALREPLIVHGQECFSTASIGIAVYPRDGHTVADLLRNADIAMYAVKAQGRNAASAYRPSLAGKGREKLELESALHKAIEREELVLYYQPKIDVAHARMVGAEALVRWQRTESMVAPVDFISLAEETGLIVPISEWVIREAARQVRAWRDAFGFAEAIAINLPNRLFERTDLVEHIHNAVTTYGVPHHCIELEITETGLMRDLQSVIPSLHRLNEIGVEIAIDDFGTGYSSLAYLTTLPISELKIDRGFVRDLGMTPHSAAVVTAIISLARSLGLRVVAEGVENLRQMDALTRLGCTVMQGYLFSRPRPPAELERWMDQVLGSRKAAWLHRAAETGDRARAQPA